MLGYGAFAQKRNVPTFCQFSGGRTSGFMTCMSPDNAVITFENTGKEHEKTLEFVQRVGDALKRDVVWLEWRPPPRIGDRPREFSFERVNYDTASRKGEPFEEFMIAINAYRSACGNDPIAPWAKMRICTAYLKHKVLDRYIESLNICAHDRMIGIRADEEHRIRGLKRQETAQKKLNAPLYEAGVSLADVMKFWSDQDFDLGIPGYLGNCDGCFLKDEADVARALGPNGHGWWSTMQEKWPGFAGHNYKNYKDLASELPTRLNIEASLREGKLPEPTSHVSPMRFKLLVIQEKKRIKHGQSGFSCACESSMDYEEDQ